jgi:hypothetical protein
MLVCNGCNGTFSLTGSFPAPHGYVGPPGEVGVGHSTVWAATMKFIREGYVGCTDGRTIRHEKVAGRDTTWIFCPPGSELDSGHVLVEWSRRGWIYALSLHSNTSTNRRLLQIMAEHVIEVR